ncbi:multiple sugar transport system substrate-binding protein [Actinoplanes tereljensis]|uniref:Sugar ABC transporter substrate-binding protein n=1 Tax=Paractinoplanes tereljensis TaxID=571912 RepID=A0A919NMV2_9ACTN|nr:extracellular solute-binding protein [Actinoplanes tereljensis]GIF20849.1 sugar ABC transporter substrate-binding protein [Actinoplanes tereljensis]
MNTVNRRGALKIAGLAGLAATLPACGRGFGGGSDKKGDTVELNMVWWGDSARAAKTQAALDLFQSAHPEIHVRTEYQDSAPYKDKLVTRFAAGDPPDLMAMRVDSLREYAGRGALLDLAQQGGKLDLSGLTDAARALGVVGQQNFGVPSGLNTVGYVVDKALTDKYGVKIPDGNTWSWPDLAAFATQVTTASAGKVYGTNFETWTIANLIVFTRQHGEDFYTADGKLGVTAATVTEWFAMVQKMRADKGFPPAGFIDPNGGASPAQSYLAKKSIASQIIPTNNFLNYNKVCGGQLQLLRMPGETQGTRRGQSIDTPALWSVAAKSKHPQEALTLLNFLVNDEAGAKAAGTTRGVPASQKVAAAIAPVLEPDDQRATTYLTELQNEKLPASYSYPIGASKLTNILKTISTEVEFGRKTPAAAATQFVGEATKALTA